MNKIILSITFTLLSVSLTFSQNESEKELEIAKQSCETFFNQIINKKNLEAYQQLSIEEQERESKDEFDLKFKRYEQHYGSLNSFSCSENRCITLFNENALAFYSLTFENIKVKATIDLIKDSSNKYKIKRYHFYTEDNNPTTIFDDMAKKPLELLMNKDIENLFTLGKDTYLSYEDFSKDLNTLIKGDSIKYELNSHEITVDHNIVKYQLNYEINQEGDIIFNYVEDGGIPLLKSIHFYLTKKIDAEMEEGFHEFLDSKLTSAQLDTLSRIDSLKLRMEFELSYFTQFTEGVQEDLGNFSISTAYDWEQLEEDDKALITQSAQKYLNKLAENDINGFWELCHSKFKETTPFVSFTEVGNLIADMIPSMDSIVFYDAKKVTHTIAPTTNKFSTGGSLDKTNSKYLQFYTLPNIKNQVLVIYKVNTTPLSKAITIKMGLEDGIYKLTSFEINTNSVNNKHAEYYTQLANKWKSKKYKIPNFIALNMAYRLSYLGKGTTTANMETLTKEIQELQKDFELINEIKKWTIDNESFDIINITFIETKNDITVSIPYVSKEKLGKRSTGKEVEVLFNYFKDKYPDVVNEFGVFIFTAYDEYPAIPSKQYDIYRVIMNSEK